MWPLRGREETVSWKGEMICIRRSKQVRGMVHGLVIIKDLLMLELDPYGELKG